MTSATVDDLWASADREPNPGLLDALSDAYAEAGERGWQEMLRWAAAVGIWPDFRRMGGIYSWWRDHTGVPPKSRLCTWLDREKIPLDVIYWKDTVSDCFTILHHWVWIKLTEERRRELLEKAGVIA